jgi:hypothetical protein
MPGMFARGEFALGNSQALSVPQQTVVVPAVFTYIDDLAHLIGRGMGRLRRIKSAPVATQGAIN